jgi:hypothetical protein
MGHVWLIRLLYRHFDPRVPDDRPSPPKPLRRAASACEIPSSFAR